MPAKANVTYVLEHLFEPSFKGGVVSITNAIDKNENSESHKILQEILAVMTSVFFYQKKSYLVDAFNEQLGIMNAAGIVNFLLSNQVKRNFTKQRQREPKLLTLAALSGSFEIIIIGWALALVAFLIELVAFSGRPANCFIPVLSSLRKRNV